MAPELSVAPRYWTGKQIMFFVAFSCFIRGHRVLDFRAFSCFFVAANGFFVAFSCFSWSFPGFRVSIFSRFFVFFRGRERFFRGLFVFFRGPFRRFDCERCLSVKRLSTSFVGRGQSNFLSTCAR